MPTLPKAKAQRLVMLFFAYSLVTSFPSFFFSLLITLICGEIEFDTFDHNDMKPDKQN